MIEYRRLDSREGPTSNSFSGFFAEFYDILHAGLADVDAYLGYAAKYGPRVLELGSGTGRVLIPLARAGFTVTGVDASDDMLAICRQRLGYEPADVQARATVVKANVLSLNLNQQFDLVVAPCNFINYFTGSGDWLRVLETARQHLSKSGIFILDNGVPDLPLMTSLHGVEQEYEFTHPLTGTTIAHRITSHYDFERQVEVDDMVLEDLDEGTVLRMEKATETLAYYFPRQMRSMLKAAGFDIVHEQGSLMEDIPVSDDAGEMVFFCRSTQAKRS